MNQFRLDLDAAMRPGSPGTHCGRCCELMQQACTAFSGPRSAWLRFPHTIDINDHVENILLVEHDLQTQRVRCALRCATQTAPPRHQISAHLNRRDLWTRAARAISHRSTTCNRRLDSRRLPELPISTARAGSRRSSSASPSRQVDTDDRLLNESRNSEKNSSDVKPVRRRVAAG